MGSGEESTPAKPSKTTAPTQEAIPAPSYNDWSTHMQAYYGAGGTPPPFFPPTVASPPPPHPYMWGNQHLIAPYGTPLPYPPLFPPPGLGLYPHQNMPMVQDTAVTTTETVKGPNGKEQVPTKKSKGNSGALVGKSKESGKVTSGSGNDGASQSAESGSEGSSDSSDENTNHRESSAATKRSFNQMLADGANAQVNHTAQYNDAAVDSSLTATGVPATNVLTSMPGNPVGTIPGTNLNIGMDLWNASPVGNVPLRARPNASGVASAVGPAKMVGREGAAPEHLWVQDERELKRQKRKQSNRESARRSRLRKQAECEELQAKVDTLGNENHNLHKELQRLSEECEKLTSENSNLVEELKQLYGPEAIISSLNGNNGAAPPVQSINGEGPQGTEHNTSMGNPELVSGPMSGNFFNSNNNNNNNNNNLEPGSN